MSANVFKSGVLGVQLLCFLRLILLEVLTKVSENPCASILVFYSDDGGSRFLWNLG